MERIHGKKTFEYIINALFDATLMDADGEHRCLGVGTFSDIANFINMKGFRNSSGGKWVGHALRMWLQRYARRNPEAYALVDWEHLGGRRSDFLTGLQSDRFDQGIGQMYDPKDYSVTDTPDIVLMMPEPRDRRGINPRSHSKLMSGSRSDKRNADFLMSSNRKAQSIHGGVARRLRPVVPAYGNKAAL